MVSKADQPQIATTNTTGAETETLVGLQGDSVMRVLRVSDSPISMYRGFEIGMAQSVSISHHKLVLGVNLERHGGPL